MSRREFLKGILAAGTCQTLSSLVPRSIRAAESETPPARWTPVEPANQPMGKAQGAYPGRVVWIHDPGITQWTGDTEDGGWHEDRFTDPARAEEMLRDTLRQLTGAKTDEAAWRTLFRYRNRKLGRGDVGYRPGEKVVVKLNLNCCKQRTNARQGFYSTPQLTAALLRQVVEKAGVRESDLVVYDASRLVPDSIFDRVHDEFPGIRFEDRDGGKGRFTVQPDHDASVCFSDPDTVGADKTWVPKCVTNATYQINAAVMKGHSLAGVTLCGKNHFGSIYRPDTGPDDPHHGWNPSHLHASILTRSRPMGTYNAMVDLMGHPHLGEKTILYLLDALYAAPHQSVLPEKWHSAPFNGDWTASVFASQDPVAIESVAVDFLGAEKSVTRVVGAVDNYLHEAALAHNPPSNTRYAPGKDGKRLGSLGVHEHWNNARQKQYTRDLGGGEGIELIRG
ncbi:MAG: DUF362 domain-containing protein [Planctomycetota bacterium]